PTSSRHHFAFHAPATPSLYTLSLHDALPIFLVPGWSGLTASAGSHEEVRARRKNANEFPAEISLSPLVTEEGLLVTSAIRDITEDRKSTRLNSSHVAISYAVFCLKKKNNNRL